MNYAILLLIPILTVLLLSTESSSYTLNGRSVSKAEYEASAKEFEAMRPYKIYEEYGVIVCDFADKDYVYHRAKPNIVNGYIYDFFDEVTGRGLANIYPPYKYKLEQES